MSEQELIRKLAEDRGIWGTCWGELTSPMTLEEVKWEIDLCVSHGFSADLWVPLGKVIKLAKAEGIIE